MSQIMSAVNEVVRKSLEGQRFSDFTYGTVKKVGPLLIETDAKAKLEDPFVSVCQHLTDYTIDCEISLPTFSAVCPDGSVHGPASGKGAIKLKNALKVGDRVVLARFSGGQRYQVIDRIGD